MSPSIVSSRSTGCRRTSWGDINARNPDGNAWARFERSELAPEEFDRTYADETHAARMQLCIAPQQAVYLDDLGANLQPARAMGMRTIKVEDPATALAELESALAVVLR
ncbi:MAG TPA: hypothetical protein VGR01_03435 [Burkholderiales bacterium]|nr:hypothetical protein [Burkholderiales bacterium]